MTTGTAVTALIKALRPVFGSKHDRLAFAVHAYFLSEGYTLVGVGDSTDTEIPTADAPEVTVDGWNNSQDLYIFKYVDQSSENSPVFVKCIVIGDFLVINALALGSDDEPCSLDANVKEYTTDSPDVVKGYQNLNALVEKLVKTMGGVGAPKKAESKPKPEQQQEQKTETQPKPGPDPLRVDPLRDPGFRRPNPGMIPGMPPGMVPGMIGGHSDLGPPGLGIGGGGRLGGGMHIGLDDPMFSGALRNPGLGQGRMPAGGQRFDPIAPAGFQGYRPDDFQPGNFGGEGERRVHPDLPQPPSRGTDFDRMFG